MNPQDRGKKIFVHHWQLVQWGVLGGGCVVGRAGGLGADDEKRICQRRYVVWNGEEDYD